MTKNELGIENKRIARKYNEFRRKKENKVRVKMKQTGKKIEYEMNPTKHIINEI